MALNTAHNAALNRKYQYCATNYTAQLMVSPGQTGFLRSLVSQDPTLVNTPDVVGRTTLQKRTHFSYT